MKKNNLLTSDELQFGSLKKILVYGDPGEGKTAMAVLWAIKYMKYKRLYGNLSIKKRGKEQVDRIEKMSDIGKIERCKDRGLLILDEVGINANSKDVRSKNNRELIEEAVFLQRKKNLDVIYLGQQLESFDIGLRRGQKVIILECRGNKSYMYPCFLIERIKVDSSGKKEGVIGQFSVDIFSYFSKNGITYNTLETSKIQKPIKEKKNKKTLDKKEKKTKIKNENVIIAISDN